MKKTLLIATLMAAGSLSVAAQTVTLSTYQGTDITRHDGQVRNVAVNRYVFQGWNTIALPFSLSASQLDETFGTDCRLERLAGVETDGLQTVLNFQDCKAEGLKANTPYILWYGGEPSSKRITAENASLRKAEASVTFCDINGTAVTFAAAQLQRDAQGIYGILARDNAEATFVSTDNITTTLYATRCYVKMSNGTSTTLTTNHIGAAETTSINAVLHNGEKADVYNLSGTRVATALPASAVAALPAGIYVVKGKKIAVR